jgi:hypothetical protein
VAAAGVGRRREISRPSVVVELVIASWMKPVRSSAGVELGHPRRIDARRESRRRCRRTPAAVQVDPARPVRAALLLVGFGRRGELDSSILPPCASSGRPVAPASSLPELEQEEQLPARPPPCLPACPVSPAAAPQPASGRPWSREQGSTPKGEIGEKKMRRAGGEKEKGSPAAGGEERGGE